jgi:uncharacterized protein YqfA (UPF0365 family)
MNDAILLIIASLLAIVILIAVFCCALLLFVPWIRALTSGAPVTFLSLLGMLLRGSPARLVTDAYAQLVHRGADVSIAEVERRFIANRRRIQSAGDLIDFVEAHAACATPST